jgi:hypothetical protein
MGENKRENYPDRRKYKTYPLKSLVTLMESYLNDLNDGALDKEKTDHALKTMKEIFFEIALRLD